MEIVAYFQRMAKLNPNIKVKYVARKDNQERKHFDSDECNKRSFLRKNSNYFYIRNGKTELVLSEFPQFLKDKMAANPEQLSN